MLKIMLVDDTVFVRMGLRKILEERGYHVVAEASNGREALRMYQQFKPDLVTLDITMPVMDGMATLKEIIKMDKTAKIIMCSTTGRKDKVIEAVRSGAVDYIVKPYHKDRVLEAIEKHSVVSVH